MNTLTHLITRLRELEAKASKAPWTLKDTSGAGLELFADVRSTMGDKFSDSLSIYGLGACPAPMFQIGYERWVQFPQRHWDEMQKANGQLTAETRNHLLALLTALETAVKALERMPCKCSRRNVYPLRCPVCAGELKSVTNETGWMNSEQFDSVKAGDFYCEHCKGEEGKSGHKYFWDKDLPKNVETCDRCAALAAINAGKEE